MMLFVVAPANVCADNAIGYRAFSVSSAQTQLGFAPKKMEAATKRNIRFMFFFLFHAFLPVHVVNVTSAARNVMHWIAYVIGV